MRVMNSPKTRPTRSVSERPKIKQSVKKFQMAKSASRSRSAGSSIRNVSSNSQNSMLFRGL